MWNVVAGGDEGVIVQVLDGISDAEVVDDIDTLLDRESDVLLDVVRTVASACGSVAVPVVVVERGVVVLQRSRVKVLQRSRVKVLLRSRVKVLQRSRVKVLQRSRVKVLQRSRVKVLQQRSRVKVLQR